MRVIESLDEMKTDAREQLARQTTVGFVPTMGALHAGHVSLIDRARRENERVVVSIFVNPTQFMPGEDYERYPRTFDEDLARAEKAGADVVFAPSAQDMYPPRFQTSVMVDRLSKPLCGMARGRGHFAGVATVVLKLFNLVRPTRAYFGQKDAQQAVVLQRMTLDLNVPVELVVCPTVREKDGLALSSRNRYLDPHQRGHALALRRALVLGRSMIQKGERDVAALETAMSEAVLADGALELDYLDVVVPETLEKAAAVDDLVLIAGAVRLGEVRLIDNLLTGPDGPFED